MEMMELLCHGLVLYGLLSLAANRDPFLSSEISSVYITTVCIYAASILCLFVCLCFPHCTRMIFASILLAKWLVTMLATTVEWNVQLGFGKKRHMFLWAQPACGPHARAVVHYFTPFLPK
jgi:hypothetical protein